MSEPVSPQDRHPNPLVDTTQPTEGVAQRKKMFEINKGPIMTPQDYYKFPPKVKHRVK